MAHAHSLEYPALLHAIVETTDDAIIATDVDGIITLWNRAAERIFGFSQAEMVGRSSAALIPADRSGEEHTVILSAIGGERVEHYETVRLHKSGRSIDMSLTVSPIRDDMGKLVGVSHIARDISGRALMERNTSRLAAIVDSSDDAIVSKDLCGVVQTWNRGAERMFGYTQAEMIGRSIGVIVPEDRLQEEVDVIARIRSGASIDHYETVRRAKDGTLVPISLTVSPIRDRDGRVVGASKIARDLSTLRAYATRLEQTVKERTASLEVANTQLEAFAYSVSHDLRAPLRGMQGLSHALLEDYGPQLDERGRDYAARIVKEAALLDQLIQDLLTYSRLTHIEVEMEDLAVGDVLDSALHHLDEDIRISHAVVRVSGSLPHVRANRTVLIQVVTNLISNALKFGGERPTIDVLVEGDGDLARISVEDHGIGIAPQHQERIFRAFERLHGVERYPGTGMGLAIVRKGIERLGGRAGVKSQEGLGSRFWVEWPRSMATA